VATVSKLTDLISADEVRGLLGVSAKELPDARVDLPIYLKIVKTSVGALDTDRRIWAAYEDLPDSNLSPAQTRFKDAFETYTGLKGASVIAVALPSMAVRSLTDGKAGFTRESGAADDVRVNLDQALADAAYELTAAAADLLPVTPLVSDIGFLFATATPGATDPVTGT